MIASVLEFPPLYCSCLSSLPICVQVPAWAHRGILFGGVESRIPWNGWGCTAAGGRVTRGEGASPQGQMEKKDVGFVRKSGKEKEMGAGSWEK